MKLRNRKFKKDLILVRMAATLEAIQLDEITSESIPGDNNGITIPNIAIPEDNTEMVLNPVMLNSIEQGYGIYINGIPYKNDCGPFSQEPESRRNRRNSIRRNSSSFISRTLPTLPVQESDISVLESRIQSPEPNPEPDLDPETDSGDSDWRQRFKRLNEKILNNLARILLAFRTFGLLTSAIISLVLDSIESIGGIPTLKFGIVLFTIGALIHSCLVYFVSSNRMALILSLFLLILECILFWISWGYIQNVDSFYLCRIENEGLARLNVSKSTGCSNCDIIKSLKDGKLSNCTHTLA